jgi:hypothetical protein
MPFRTVVAHTAVLALGIAIGVGINRPTAGQGPAAAPVAAAAMQAGRYQLSQGIVAGLLFIDTATGRIWELEPDPKVRRWAEFPSPVLRGGANR